jgi:hypothetical protein
MDKHSEMKDNYCVFEEKRLKQRFKTVQILRGESLCNFQN